VKQPIPIARVLVAVLGAAIALWSALMLWIGLADGGWRDWAREFNPVVKGLYGVLLMLGFWLVSRAVVGRRSPT
jgi:hypothetical protein